MAASRSAIMHIQLQPFSVIINMYKAALYNLTFCSGYKDIVREKQNGKHEGS